MPGPGEYRPDPSGHHPHRGLAQAQDPLPEPKLPSSTLSTLRPDRPSRSAGSSTLHDLGNPLTGRPAN